jgi:ectoine hydroxylase-related dioxygenase (phytanoyl-CoA dioxygenase family)
MAAWTAIDDVDAENGGMFVVPKTERMDIVCPDKADENESWTTHLVPPPKGAKPVLAAMKAGDTLFFNGSLIHGSGPNRSKTRFRRSFICHYVAASTRKISHFYLPLVSADGTDVFITRNDFGGPCGTSWAGAAHG